MLISLDWISDFIDLSDQTPEAIADQLSLKTAEVEEVITLERATADAIVARVISCAPVEGKDKLQLVEVDLGGRKAKCICGAPNVREGMLAPFLGPGAKTIDGTLIKAIDFGGVKSEGMLCAASEIGIGTDRSGLLELPDTMSPGEALAKACPPTDTLIEIDNKSLTHRPDLWGHYGFARECSAIFNRPLRELEVFDLPTSGDLPEVPVEIEDTALCPVYTATRLKVESGMRSPLVVQRRLAAVGSTPRNLLVDLSNYVQLELGQPNHVFDADKLPAPGIRIAPSGKPRKIETLDGETWEVTPEDLLIFSGDEPVAIAGVMGGGGSEVSGSTTHVLLESANFDATRVRRTSTRLGLRTDASLRFEKKLPPVCARIGAERLVHLLGKFGSCEPASRLSIAGDLHDAWRPVSLPPGFVDARAGVAIEPKTVTSILTSIGFNADATEGGGYEVLIPPFRGQKDMSTKEDVFEEITRLFGYERIEPALPIAPTTPVEVEQTLASHHRQRRLLAKSHAFNEVQSYGWMSDSWLAKIGYEPQRTLILRNPPHTDRRRLRTSLLPNLFEFASQNRRRYADFRIYELGKVFHADAEGRSTEHNELSGVIVHQGKSKGDALRRDVQTVRKVIDDLVDVAGLPALDWRLRDEAEHAWEIGGYTLEALLDGEPIGRIGVASERVTSAALKRGHIVWFSVLPDRLSGESFPSKLFDPLPQFPGSTQDLTFEVPREGGYQKITDALARFEHPLLARWSFVGSFDPPDSDASRYTFRFVLQDPTRTLGAEDLSQFHDDALHELGGLGVVAG